MHYFMIYPYRQIIALKVNENSYENSMKLIVCFRPHSHVIDTSSNQIIMWELHLLTLNCDSRFIIWHWIAKISFQQ